MYDQINERMVTALVEGARRDFPGFTGRIPLRVEQPPKDLAYGRVEGVGTGRTADGREVYVAAVPTPEWAGRTCAICRRPFVVLDHWERRRNGPHAHRRSVTPTGLLAFWIPRDTLNAWFHRSGATYAGPTVTPGALIEFCRGDLPDGIGAAIARTNRGVLLDAEGTVHRANATIGARS